MDLHPDLAVPHPRRASTSLTSMSKSSTSSRTRFGPPRAAGFLGDVAENDDADDRQDRAHLAGSSGSSVFSGQLRLCTSSTALRTSLSTRSRLEPSFASMRTEASPSKTSALISSMSSSPSISRSMRRAMSRSTSSGVAPGNSTVTRIASGSTLGKHLPAQVERRIRPGEDDRPHDEVGRHRVADGEARDQDEPRACACGRRLVAGRECSQLAARSSQLFI